MSGVLQKACRTRPGSTPQKRFFFFLPERWIQVGTFGGGELLPTTAASQTIILRFQTSNSTFTNKEKLNSAFKHKLYDITSPSCAETSQRSNLRKMLLKSLHALK